MQTVYKKLHCFLVVRFFRTTELERKMIYEKNKIRKK